MPTSLRTSSLVAGLSLALMALLAPAGLLIALPAGATGVAALVVLVIATLDVIVGIALYPLLASGGQLLARTATAMRVAYAGARGAAIKLGARGAAMLHCGEYLELAPPEQPDVVDTTGAGDCFDAGFLYAWLNGGAAAECLRVGNLCGALSTRALGGIAGFPQREELS